MTSINKRPLKLALWNGFKRKCPNCQEGNLFVGYLKVTDHCPACNEDFSHQRADDGPAWATMMVVGHLIPAPLMYIFETFDEPAPWKVGLFLGFFVIIATLLLLPRIKGLFVALQWANLMHGFGNSTPKTQYTEKFE